MLFPYTYVPHQMERMQEFINFIFHEVWCKASVSGPFDLNLFAANADLRELMGAFYYSDAKGADFFYGHVERIYGLFSALTADQINQLQQWYQGNNDLEKVCAIDPATHLARYVDIAVNHKELAAQLGAFFKGLYSQSLLNLAALRDKIGDIDDHYKTFVQTNKAGKCPFCGINDLLSEYHTKREAYDHYLPKALYPFNSINFRNLVPACHHCNSSYKTSQNPAYTPKDPAGVVRRRAVFYPYKTTQHSIELQVVLHQPDIAKLTPADITLLFGPAAVTEELDTWKDVYGIEERYKAKLCGENDGKYWLIQVLDEWKEGGRDTNEFMSALARQVQKRPYADCNFLRKPFLDACKKIGLL
ncbi:HNH endonuclease [Pseudomonas soli]|uniref:HNH endonuclease n=1 Tax=Pseudomonas soli TaxID=1306993 RepID=UPI003DA9DBAE